MKKKVFIIFKYPHEWNAHVIDKFSNYYDTEHLYISEIKTYCLQVHFHKRSCIYEDIYKVSYKIF